MPRRRPLRREEASRADDGATTRLVYSTGGETPPADPDADTPRAQGSAPKSPSRSGGGVRLRLERRASGRTVTVVTGLPGTPAQVALLARELRTVCGAGGTARGGEVELQGDQREKAAAALAARGLRVNA
jgi:translation initiation factor 1